MLEESEVAIIYITVDTDLPLPARRIFYMIIGRAAPLKWMIAGIVISTPNLCGFPWPSLDTWYAGIRFASSTPLIYYYDNRAVEMTQGIKHQLPRQGWPASLE